MTFLVTSSCSHLKQPSSFNHGFGLVKGARTSSETNWTDILIFFYRLIFYILILGTARHGRCTTYKSKQTNGVFSQRRSHGMLAWCTGTRVILTFTTKFTNIYCISQEKFCLLPNGCTTLIFMLASPLPART